MQEDGYGEGTKWISELYVFKFESESCYSKFKWKTYSISIRRNDDYN